MEFEQNDRWLELRRRVQADPASVAFAELAEACRRDGDNEEAVALCRAGLQHHPGYLSARVTLALALIELSRLDEAETELKIALQAAPDHLAANRALAEIYQRRGQRREAGALYRKALELARLDRDEPAPAAAEPAPEATSSSGSSSSTVKELFDFDTLLEQLGGRTQPARFADPAMPGMPVGPMTLPAPPPDDGDPFSVLERQLRDVEDQRPVQAPPGEDELRELRVLDELEDWLSAIVSDRDNHPTV